MRRLVVYCLLLGVAGCALVQPPVAERYFVFFQPWSADLDNSSKAVIRSAASYAKAHPDGMVTVTGYADPTGTAKANVDISAVRAQVVADALTADGVNPARIQRRAHGVLEPNWSTQESRRVDIAIGK